MKYTLLQLFFIFCTLSGYAQTGENKAAKSISLPLAANKIEYTATVKLDTSFSKETLFHNAEDWYKHTLESNDNTLTINNPEEGQLSGTGVIHAKRRERKIYPDDLFFSIDIGIKQGSYSYRLYDIYSFENEVKFYYSDMYGEERYPLDKPKWTEEYRHTMLTNMDIRLKDLLRGMNDALVHGIKTDNHK